MYEGGDHKGTLLKQILYMFLSWSYMIKSFKYVGYPEWVSSVTEWRLAMFGKPIVLRSGEQWLQQVSVISETRVSLDVDISVNAANKEILAVNSVYQFLACVLILQHFKYHFRGL
jgi:hypothetical protein